MANLLCDRIFVDQWIPIEGKPCAYFMSTFRPELREVLNKSWKFPIYSSELNIQTLKGFTEVKHELLHPLKFNSKEYISLEDYNFYVVPIDSESLSGSVIYHFICPNGEFLYMGRIRISTEILKNKYIAELGANGSIDGLYVDTSLLRTNVNFTLEQAANSVIRIIKNYPDLKFVMAVPVSGYDDLLMEIANRGIVVFPGSYRMQFYKIQGIDKHFSESRKARLRIVNIGHCMDISDVKRRLIEQGIVTLMPSTIVSPEQIASLREAGLHIILFADSTTIRSFLDLLNIVKPVQLHSVQNDPSFMFEPFAQYLRNANNTSVLNSAQNFPPDREPLHKTLTISDESQERSPSVMQLLQDLTNFDELTPEREMPDIFKKNKDKNVGIFTKDKNTDHLITDTQISFHPMATSTQQSPPEPDITDDTSTVLIPSQISDVSQIPASNQMSQNIPNSQRNMNRFDEEYVNDPLNRKNKLNRLHLVNIFGPNSMNRAASISKAIRTVEVSCQTDQPLGDIILPENVIQEISPRREVCETGDSLGTQTHLSFIEPRRKKVAFNSDLNIVHEMNASHDSSDREVISSSELSLEEGNESIVYPDMSMETIILETSVRPATEPAVLNESSIGEVHDEREIREQAQNVSGTITHTQNIFNTSQTENDEELAKGDSADVSREVCKTEVQLAPCYEQDSQGSSVLIIIEEEPLPVAHVELTCSSMDLQNIMNSTAGSNAQDPLMSSFERINNVIHCSPVNVDVICEGSSNNQGTESDLEKCSQVSYYTRISQVKYDDALFSDEEDEEAESFMTCVNVDAINQTENSNTKTVEVSGVENVDQISTSPNKTMPDECNPPDLNKSNESIISESSHSDISVITIPAPVFVHLNSDVAESQIIYSHNEEVRNQEDIEVPDAIVIDSNTCQQPSQSTKNNEGNLQKSSLQKSSPKKNSLQQQSILQHFRASTPIPEPENQSQNNSTMEPPLQTQDTTQSSLLESNVSESMQKDDQNNPKGPNICHSSLQTNLSLPSTSRGFCSEMESMSSIGSAITTTSVDSMKSLTVPCYISLERLSDETVAEYQEELVLTDRQKLRIQYNKEKSEDLEQFSIAELEPFHKKHLFTKKALQFLDDNFLEPKKLGVDLQRFRYANMWRNLDNVEKLEKEKSKNKGGKGVNKKGRGKRKGG